MKSDIAMKASSKFPAYDFLGDSNVMNGCGMDGWMDGWMDGRTDRQVIVFSSGPSSQIMFTPSPHS